MISIPFISQANEIREIADLPVCRLRRVLRFMHDFDSIYFACLIQFSGHGARACSAGVGQQTGSRQSACRPISCAVTSAEFLFAEWQNNTHGGGCEQAVVRS